MPRKFKNSDDYNCDRDRAEKMKLDRLRKELGCYKEKGNSFTTRYGSNSSRRSNNS